MSAFNSFLPCELQDFLPCLHKDLWYPVTLSDESECGEGGTGCFQVMDVTADTSPETSLPSGRSCQHWTRRSSLSGLWSTKMKLDPC